MSESIRDAEALGRILHEVTVSQSAPDLRVTWEERSDNSRKWFRERATAVAIAVCPPDHVVVPRALIEAAKRSVDAYFGRTRRYDGEHKAMCELEDELTALATEPAPGKEPTK